MRMQNTCPNCGHEIPEYSKPRPGAWKTRESTPGKIDLLKGFFCLIDPEDQDFAESLSWYRDASGYAVRGFKRPKYRRLYLHREIAARSIGRELLPDEVVDHINRDKLDNRRSNLRVCTPAQNAANKSLQVNSTTGFKGVSLAPSGNYHAAIRLNGTSRRLGSFPDPREAAWMFDQFAIGVYGEYAATNFEYV